MRDRIKELVLSLVLIVNGTFASELLSPAVTRQVKDDDPLLHSLYSVLTDKMSKARDTVQHGSPVGHVLALDPFKIEPISFTVQEYDGFANVSLKKISVEGLGDFQIEDIVTHLYIYRTAVLLRFPEIRVKATYKLKGFLSPPFSQSLLDEGFFEAKIPNAEATWVGRIELANSSNTESSISSLSQESLNTYWDPTYAFSSFLKKNEEVLGLASELLYAISTSVVEKVQRLVEEGLEQVFALVMGRAKQTSWIEMYPPIPTHPTTTVIDPEFEAFFKQLEEDTSPFVAIGEETPYTEEDEPVSEGRSGRKKRQLPCENGEALDDYVDTLLRFGRRLIRFQEPITVPNTTVKVDELVTLFVHKIEVRSVSDISRKKNSYVRCTNSSTTLGVVVRVNNPRLNFKFRVFQYYRLLLFNGDLELRISDVTVLAQLTQFTDPDGSVFQSFDRLKVWKMGKVTVKLRGLGGLTSALSMLVNRELRENPKAFNAFFEAQVTHAIRHALKDINIPIFSLI